MVKSRTQRGVLLLLIALILFSLYVRGTFRGEGLRRALLAVTTPPQEVLNRAYDAVSDFVSHYLYLLEVEKENRRLKEEIKRLKLERQLLSEKAREAERLKKLLGFKRSAGLKVMPARVVGISPQPQSRAFYIDKGSQDGIKKGMAVVSHEGVVGRVTVVGAGSSLVVPIVEKGAKISVILEHSRTRALLEGLGWGCRLLYIPKEEEVREGEKVLTSGLDGVYPKGLMVGTVRRVVRRPGELFLEVEVVPSVDLSRLEEVLVVLEG